MPPGQDPNLHVHVSWYKQIQGVKCVSCVVVGIRVGIFAQELNELCGMFFTDENGAQ